MKIKAYFVIIMIIISVIIIDIIAIVTDDLYIALLAIPFLVFCILMAFHDRFNSYMYEHYFIAFGEGNK